jgi:FkbH-like protein
VLELINKTNQFNLNGRRYTEAELRNLLDQRDAVLLKASYKDKFGPLGTIAVILGWKRGDMLRIHSWVMSCRAFSRRIEHQCLHQIFRLLSVQRVELDYVETERNRPLQDFLSEGTGTSASPGMPISSELFAEKCPRLYHYVEETVNE